MREVVEGVRVGVIHGPGGRIRPVWFDLNRRQHRVTEVTNSWCEKCGHAGQLHFHVTDEGALYELVYNLDSGCWRVELLEAL